MTRLSRLCPVWALAVRSSRKAAKLTAANRALRADLAAANAERESLRVHFALAVTQRDRARADLIAATCPPEPPDAWGATDDALLGAWLDGERPA